ncbi:MAG: fasciclin domain-containing protein [Myxococcota bacterium]
MKTLTRILIVAVLGAAAPALAGHHARQDIVQTASAAGQFNTLLAAAKAAGLAPALSGEGPLTVFAPTDEAFGALPSGTVEELLKPKNRGKLTDILKLHVVSGKVGSGSLTNGGTLKTLSGAHVKFTETERGFSVNGARIAKTDINATNGIIHVIDRVILP